MNIVIGIAGGSASGKTTVANNIQDSFGIKVVLLQHDSFYKAAKQGSTVETRAAQNYDHPDALDTEMLIEALKQLKAGKETPVPVYNFETHDRMDTTNIVFPAKVIVVDGILLFQNPELRELLDIKVFIDTADDLRFIRRLTRDVEQRGRTMSSVISQWVQTVRPMHLQFVEPSKRHADIVIPFEKINEIAMHILVSKIDQVLNT
jgi:uridine kinase